MGNQQGSSHLAPCAVPAVNVTTPTKNNKTKNDVIVEQNAILFKMLQDRIKDWNQMGTIHTVILTDKDIQTLEDYTSKYHLRPSKTNDAVREFLSRRVEQMSRRELRPLSEFIRFADDTPSSTITLIPTTTTPTTYMPEPIVNIIQAYCINIPSLVYELTCAGHVTLALHLSASQFMPMSERHWWMPNGTSVLCVRFDHLLMRVVPARSEIVITDQAEFDKRYLKFDVATWETLALLKFGGYNQCPVSLMESALIHACLAVGYGHAPSASMFISICDILLNRINVNRLASLPDLALYNTWKTIASSQESWMTDPYSTVSVSKVLRGTGIDNPKAHNQRGQRRMTHLIIIDQAWRYATKNVHDPTFINDTLALATKIDLHPSDPFTRRLGHAVEYIRNLALVMKDPRAILEYSGWITTLHESLSEVVVTDGTSIFLEHGRFTFLDHVNMNSTDCMTLRNCILGPLSKQGHASAQLMEHRLVESALQGRWDAAEDFLAFLALSNQSQEQLDEERKATVEQLQEIERIAKTHSDQTEKLCVRYILDALTKRSGKVNMGTAVDAMSNMIDHMSRQGHGAYAQSPTPLPQPDVVAAAITIINSTQTDNNVSVDTTTPTSTLTSTPTL